MKINFLIISLLLLVTSHLVTAQTQKIPARIYLKDGTHVDAFITAYRKGFVSYIQTGKDLRPKRKGPKDIQSIYFKEVAIFKEAMDLYKSRKYAQAKKKFIACEDAYKIVETVSDNYSTRAGFFSLECSRRLFDLEALSNGMKTFRKDALTRPHQLEQLEVNAFWEAFRLEEWEGLNTLALEWAARKVTGSQRAQIAYCHGRAYEELAKKDPKLTIKALNTYNRALSADFATSTELVIASASSVLRIYAEDPKVKLAMKHWKTRKTSGGGVGQQRLREANAMVRFYQQGGFDKIKDLSDDAKKFLKYDETAQAK